MTVKRLLGETEKDCTFVKSLKDPPTTALAGSEEGRSCMSKDEEFLEEGNTNVGGSEAVEESQFNGTSEAPSPELTASILQDLKALESLTFGTRWSQDDASADSGNPTQRSYRPRPRFQNRERSGFNRNNRPPFDRQRNRSGDRFLRPEGDRGTATEASAEAGAQEGASVRPDRGPRDTNFRNRDRRDGKFQGKRPFNRDSGGPHGRFEQREHRIFIPPFEVNFYKEDQAFEALLAEMRKNCKTYELFTVAQLILQKPERFVATVRRRPNREGVVVPLYLSLLDDLPFESEHEAMSYIIQHHIEEFFDVQEEQVEPPKGHFTCVYRCGVTGKLLSAPNYHRYKTILRDHFNAAIHSMPFERFVAKIETSKAEEDIQKWLEEMSRKVTYTPKAIDESVTDREPIETLEGVKNYLLKYYKDRILREVTTVRVTGTDAEKLPSVGLAKAIQFFLQRQRQFPLDTANNLRNPFRHVGFGIYRKGKNGISYVCAVKRKFRTPDDVFTPNIQALIEFLKPLEKTTLTEIQKNYVETQQLDEAEVLEGLNWLIHEGYVVAYENGDLYLNPELKVAPRGEQSVTSEAIALKQEETAIEKFSDGTLVIQESTTLLIPGQEAELSVPEEMKQKGDTSENSGPSEEKSSESEEPAPEVKEETPSTEENLQGAGEKVSADEEQQEKTVE